MNVQECVRVGVWIRLYAATLNVKVKTEGQHTRLLTRTRTRRKHVTHLGEGYFDTIPLLLVGRNIANRPKHLDQIPQPRLVLLHRRRPLPRGVARLALLERHLSFRERIGAHLLKDEDEGSKDGERMVATSR